MEDQRYEYSRFPGPRPFYDTPGDRGLFFARDQEKQSLLQEVLANNLVVLYGPDGIGKTSLLNAGILPELKRRNFFPVTVRFDQTGIDPIATVYKGIADSAAQNRWYFDPGEEDTLWQYFKTLALRSSDNTLLQPVLLLDPFNDFFLFHTGEAQHEFIRQLAEVVNNTIPQSLRESIKPGTPFLYSLAPPAVKIIIVLPEDFMPRLEEFTHDYPGVFNCRFRLKGLNREQAYQAITGPTLFKEDSAGLFPFQFSPEAVDMILNFLSQAKEAEGFNIVDEVDPFSLQLLCRSVEEKVRERLKKGETDIIIEPGHLGGEKGMKKAMTTFYDSQVKGLGPASARGKARRLCERGLIRGNRRVKLERNIVEDKFKVPGDILDKLTAGGLVHHESPGEETCYELSHDKLVPLIRGSFFKNQLKQITAAGVIIVCVVLLVGILGNISKYLPTNKRVVLAKYLRQGTLSYRKGDYKQAAHFISKAIAISPNYALPYNDLGITLTRQGKYREAVDAYQRAVELNPGYNTARANLAEAALLAEQFDIAFFHAQELLKQQNLLPDLSMAMRMVSIAAELFQGKAQEALVQLRAFITYYKGLPRRYARNWDYRDVKEFQTISPKIPRGQMSVLLQVLDILRGARADGNKKIGNLEVLMQQVFESVSPPPGRGPAARGAY